MELRWTDGLCPEGENIMDYNIVDCLCVYLHMFVPTVSMAAGGCVALQPTSTYPARHPSQYH